MMRAPHTKEVGHAHRVAPQWQRTRGPRAARALEREAEDVARGLRIRCDWGPQYVADAWIKEVKLPLGGQGGPNFEC